MGCTQPCNARNTEMIEKPQFNKLFELIAAVRSQKASKKQHFHMGVNAGIGMRITAVMHTFKNINRNKSVDKMLFAFIHRKTMHLKFSAYTKMFCTTLLTQFYVKKLYISQLYFLSLTFNYSGSNAFFPQRFSLVNFMIAN